MKKTMRQRFVNIFRIQTLWFSDTNVSIYITTYKTTIPVVNQNKNSI